MADNSQQLRAERFRRQKRTIEEEYRRSEKILNYLGVLVPIFALVLLCAAIQSFSDISDFTSVSAFEHQEYYEVLGITPEANTKQIKRAFRKLSLKYHPDKNPNDPNIKEKFQEINQAYEILSNDEKRQIYDLEGKEGLEQHEKRKNAPASPFDAFFGNGFQKRKGPDAHVDISVTLEDLYNGAERSARISRNVICTKCRGTGAKGGKMKKCHHCQGRGVRIVNQRMGPGFTVQMQQPCPHCDGKGKIMKARCGMCGGRGVREETKLLTAEIERGMPSDEVIRFERESEQQPGITPGDVLFHLRLESHPLYRREGSDLFRTVKISLRESLLGFRLTIKQLDDSDIEVIREGITKPFEVVHLKGKGMPVHNYPSSYGTLHLTFEVEYPKDLTDEQRSVVKSIFKEVKHDEL